MITIDNNKENNIQRYCCEWTKIKLRCRLILIRFETGEEYLQFERVP